MKEFQPCYIQGNTLDDAWFQLLKEIDQTGIRYKIDTGSHAGEDRIEPVFVAGFVHFPHTKPLAPIMPEASPLPAPTTDGDIEKYFADYLMDPQLNPNEEYRYSTWINGQLLHYPRYCAHIKCEHYQNGHAMVADVCEKSGKSISILEKDFVCPLLLDKPNTGVDWVIHHFKKKGFGNNHCYINIGDRYTNLNYEIPYTNETERRTSPCLRGLDFKVKNNKLILGVIYRSWDAWGGWPENMGGLTLLNEYVAEEIGVEPGPMAFASFGCHCYSHHIEVVNMRLGKE